MKIILEHKNAICLQKFRKHDKFTYLPHTLKNTVTASYSTFKCVFHVGMSVFVLVYVIPPTVSLPNSISTPWVARWWKTQHIAGISEMGKRSQILPELKSLGIHLKSSVTIVILKRGYINSLTCSV